MNSNLTYLEKKLSLKFNNEKLLENIFIHRSYLNEHKKFYLPSNEKLEFLGDSVLSLITSIYLYKNYPQLKEGDYTDIKAAIVCTDSLSEAAQQLNLGQFLYLSKGEHKSGGRINVNILADCFEALIAGIFIEFGFDKAYRFVLDYLFNDKLSYIISHKLYLAPKTRLQEFAQAKFKVTPIYRLIKSVGPEHNKTFMIQVFINDSKLATASGKSKKEAEEKAAKIALKNTTTLV